MCSNAAVTVILYPRNWRNMSCIILISLVSTFNTSSSIAFELTLLLVALESMHYVILEEGIDKEEHVHSLMFGLEKGSLM